MPTKEEVRLAELERRVAELDVRCWAMRIALRAAVLMLDQGRNPKQLERWKRIVVEPLLA